MVFTDEVLIGMQKAGLREIEQVIANVVARTPTQQQQALDGAGADRKRMTQEMMDFWITSRRREFTAAEKEEVRGVLEAIRVDEFGRLSKKQDGKLHYQASLKLMEGYTVKAYTVTAFVLTPPANLERLRRAGQSIDVHHFLKIDDDRLHDVVKNHYYHPVNMLLLTENEHDRLKCYEEAVQRDYEDERDHFPVRVVLKDGTFMYFKSPRQAAEYCGATRDQLNTQIDAAVKILRNYKVIPAATWKNKEVDYLFADPHAFDSVAHQVRVASDFDGEKWFPVDFAAFNLLSDGKYTTDEINNFIDHTQVSNMGRLRQSFNKIHMTRLVRMWCKYGTCEVCKPEEEGNCNAKNGHCSWGPGRKGTGYGPQYVSNNGSISILKVFAAALKPDEIKFASQGGVKVEIKNIGGHLPILKDNLVLHVSGKEDESD
jgi:hypothetical protein